MTAATTDRITKESWHAGPGPTIPLTAATKIPGGVMVMVVAGTGTALNAANTASGIVQGVSTQLVDTVLGHADCPTKRGAFWWANDASLTAANIGQLAEVIDNVTVGATASNHVIAGEIMAVDSVDGVLVDMSGRKVSS